MSQKFEFFYQRAFLIPLLVWLMGMVACDPCRQLADRICNCRETEEERRECSRELSLARQHEYFKNASEPGVCLEALQKCTSCLKINNNDDAECGMYRLTPNKN